MVYWLATDARSGVGIVSLFSLEDKSAEETEGIKQDSRMPRIGNRNGELARFEEG